MPGVVYLAMTSGAFDMVMLVRAADVHHLRDVVLGGLHEVPQVRTTQTVFVLEEHGRCRFPDPGAVSALAAAHDGGRGLLDTPRPWPGSVPAHARPPRRGRLGPFRDSLPAEVPAVVLVLPVVVAGVVGGRLAAVVVAVEGALTLALVFLGAGSALGRVRRGGPHRADRVPRRGGRRRGLVGTVATADRSGHGGGRTRVALQELDEARSGLLRSVSHDLRTPLAVIRRRHRLRSEPPTTMRPATSCWAWSAPRPSGWTGSWPTCSA